MKPAQWESATAPTLGDFEVLAADAWKRLPEEFRAKATDLLDWHPRPVAETMLDTARSLLDAGLAGR